MRNLNLSAHQKLCHNTITVCNFGGLRGKCMRELLFNSKEAEEEGGIKYRFDYYMLIEEISGGNDLICENYGVKIASPDQNGDVLAIGNITMSVKGIETLLKLLSDNFVTPVSLPYVVEDWLSN